LGDTSKDLARFRPRATSRRHPSQSFLLVDEPAQFFSGMRVRARGGDQAREIREPVFGARR
jgi:hypothetical protein